MNQLKSSAELKDIAKEKLTGKYGTSMLATPLMELFSAFVLVCPLIILLAVPYVVYCVTTNTAVNEPLVYLVVLVLMIVCMIFLGIFKTGVALYYLNIACGKRYSVSDVFFGLRWQFKKSLALSAITTLLSTLFMIPYYIFSFLEAYYYEPLWSILTAVSYLVALVLYLPIQLELSQCFYLLLDFPKYSTMELLKLSARIMKGHKKKLFYIQLSFFPLELLSACSLNIGKLWLIPYENMTYTLFFLELMQPKKTSDTDTAYTE